MDYRNFFRFSRAEARGAYVLIVIALGLTLWLILLKRQQFNQQMVPDKYRAMFIAWQKSVDSAKQQSKIAEDFKSHNDSNRVYVSFDPNNAGFESFAQFGLNLHQYQSIEKFRNKGGRFYKPSDVSKMYVINYEMFQRMLPWIRIADTRVSAKSIKHVPFQKQPEQNIIELNTADTLQLIEIKGIGAVLASRIIKYRNRLGGFCSAQQLGEVYGIDKQWLTNNNRFFKVNINEIKKINFEKASYFQLSRHPYIGKELAGMLMRERTRKIFKNVGELANAGLVTIEQSQILEPYLQFQQP